MSETEDKSITLPFFAHFFRRTRVLPSITLAILLAGLFFSSQFVLPQIAAPQNVFAQESTEIYLPTTMGGTASEGALSQHNASNTGANSTGSVNAAAVNVAPTIELWYGDTQSFGQKGTPQQWINLLGNISPADENISIAPNPEYNQVDYSLNGIKASDNINLPRLNLGPGPRRVYGDGDFNLELDVGDLNSGTNSIIISATHSGGTVVKNVTLNYNSTNTWPLPYTADWGSIANINNVHSVAQIVDGKWRLDGDALRTDELGYDRIVAFGDRAWTEYEAVVPITIHAIDSTIFGSQSSGSPGLGLVTRWEGHTNNPAGAAAGCLVAHCGYLPQGANPFYDFEDETTGQLYMAGIFDNGNGGIDDEIDDPENRVLAFDTTYLWKIRVENRGADRTRYSFKLWEEGQPEPLRFQMVGEEDTTQPDVQKNGSLLVVAHHVDLTIGDVVITEPAPIITQTLTTNVVGGGSITVDPIYDDYINGETITVTAVPSVGWRFTGWTGDLTSSNLEETLVMNADKSITATFEEVTTATINISYSGSGSGIVQLNPDQPLYNIGDVVQLTALPNAGSQFDGWDNDLAAAGLTNPVTMTVELSNNITAEFGPNQSGIRSDNFNSCSLDTSIWTYTTGYPQDPTSPEFTGSDIALIAPAGRYHLNVTDGPLSARIMQPMNNGDFHIETKLLPLAQTASQGSQHAGILVYADDSNFYNFELAWEDGDVKIAGYGISGGNYYGQSFGFEPEVENVRYLQLLRNLDTFYLSYSADGVTWYQAPALFVVLNVTQIGLYAGNDSVFDENNNPIDGTEPKMTAVFDYFHNLDALAADDGPVTDYQLTLYRTGNGTVDINPELPSYGCGQSVTLTPAPGPGSLFDRWGEDLSGSSIPQTVAMTADRTVRAFFTAIPTHTLTVSIEGNGTVSVSPEQPTYLDGATVSLTAVPTDGLAFLGWSGDLGGKNTSESLTMDDDKSVTAKFGELVTATLALNVIGDGLIQVVPQKSVYEVGDVVTLTAIPSANAAFSEWEDDLLGEEENPARLLIDSSKVITAKFGPNLSGIRSDDFNACGLSSFWTYTGGYISDPQTPSFSGTQMALMVPGDQEHYATAEGNTSVRVFQAVQNTNFGVEVKFTADMGEEYQTRGLYVEDAAGKLLEFQFYHDGERYNLYVPPVNQDDPILISPAGIAVTPTYVQLERTDDEWTISYSEDGITWSQRKFDQPLAVTRIGIFGGNTAGEGNPFPANPVLVDYFYNLEALTIGDQPVTQYPLTVDIQGQGAVDVSPPFPLFGCNPLVTLTARPGEGQLLAGWGGDASGSGKTTELVVNGPKSVIATFDDVPTAELTVNIDGAGTVVVTPTLGSYVVGTEIMLKAVAAPDVTFLGWGGALSGRTINETLIMDSDKEVTATFGIPVSVNLALDTIGNGRILVQPELETYLVGDEVTLTAIPDDGSAFSSWSGDLPDEDGAETLNPLTIVLDTDKVLTAQFGQNVSGIRSDDFNRCQLASFWTYQTGYATDPAEPYFSGTELALYASDEREYYNDSEDDFLITLSQAVNDTDFRIELKFLSAMSAAYQSRGLYIEDNFGERLQIEFFHDGEAYQLFTRNRPELLPLLTTDRQPTYLALSRVGDDWTVAYSEDGERWKEHTFSDFIQVARLGVFAGAEANDGVMPGHQLVLDYFYNVDALTGGDQPIDQYPLIIDSNGVGSVDVIPNFAKYGCSQPVTLIAKPGETQVLGSWGGAISGSSSRTQVTVNGPTTVTANFIQAPTFVLTTDVVGQGTIAITPTLPAYLSSQIITATATPAEGYEFAGWSGSLFPPGGNPIATNPIGFSLVQDAQLTANFVSSTPIGTDSIQLFLPFINQSQPTTSATQAQQSLSFRSVQAANGPYAFSAPSAPTIDVWYGTEQNVGQHGVTQQWINIPGTVTDVDAITSLTYALNGDTAKSLLIGPGERRIAESGDFNIEIDKADLVQGENTVVITAENEFAQTASETVTLTYDGTSGQSLPYSIDWSTVTNVNDVAHVMDGKWSASAAGLRPTQIAYDRVVAIGDMSWTEYEVEVPITIHSIDETSFDKPKSVAPSLGIIMRWQGHTVEPPDSTVGCLMAHCGWLPQGSNPNYSFKRENGVISADLKLSGGDEAEMDDPLARELSFGTTYIWKVRIENLDNGEVRHSFKLWEEGQPEPALYQMIVEEVPTIDAGSLLLLAHHIDATFGNVTVTVPEVIETATIDITTAGNGSATVSPNQATYVVGQDVMLTADPSIGWQFQAWTGDLISADNPITITVDSSKEITAVFAPITTADVSVNAIGNGSIKISPQQSEYSIGQTITVTAVADSGSELSEWGQDFAAETTNPVVLILDRDYEIEATFVDNASGILSDDFNSCSLADFWTYVPGLDDVNPAPAFSGTSLAMTAPGGAEHYAEESVQLLQTVNDTDFDIEVKFNSSMNAAYQARGFIVKDDFGSLLRFEFFHDGGTYNIYVADENGARLVPGQPIGIVPTYARLQRVGTEWVIYFSPTGNEGDWDSRSINQSFEVDQIGLFVGNTAPESIAFPTHFGEVEYFYNRKALTVGDQPVAQYPVDVTSLGGGAVELSPDFARFGCNQTIIITTLPDEGNALINWSGNLSGSNPVERLLVDSAKSITANFGVQELATLNTDTVGNGTIVITPNVTSIAVGQSITLEAVPQSGWRFDRWSGDLSGSVNRTTLLMDANKAVIANFSEITTAQISKVITGSGSIQIEPDAEEYFIGQTITVTAVSEGDGQFSEWRNDLAGETKNPLVFTLDGDLTFGATFGLNDSGIRSDDFNQCEMADFWTYEQGLASAPPTASISGLNLALSLPPGIEHYAEDAVRIMQPAENVDFAVEVKFNSTMDAKYQTRGIVLEDDSGDLLRFEFYHDGSGYNLIVVPEGTPFGIFTQPGIDSPSYIRLAREGTIWSIAHSEDGTEDSWQVHDISYNFVVNKIGLFAGNSGEQGGPIPGHTLVVDYFHNLDALSGGDIQPVEQYELDLDIDGAGAIVALPVLERYGCGQPVMLIATGAGGSALASWTGDIGTINSGSSAQSITIQMDGNKSVTANFGQGKVYLPLSFY